MQVRRTAILSPLAPPPIGPYSQAVRAGNTIYVSGTLGVDPATAKLREVRSTDGHAPVFSCSLSLSLSLSLF